MPPAGDLLIVIAYRRTKCSLGVRSIGIATSPNWRLKKTGTLVGQVMEKEGSGHKKTRKKAGMEYCYLFFKYTCIITYVSSPPTPLLDLKAPKGPDNLLPNMSL